MENVNRRGFLDDLIDEDGLKTEVTLTLTNRTVTRIVTALLISGLSLMVIQLIIRQLLPNPQLVDINKKLEQLKIPKAK